MYDTALIGKRLKQRRKELGLTLDDIGIAICVAKSTIQRYEAGLIKTPKIPVIESIARVLHVSADWLLGKSDEPDLPKNLIPCENTDNRAPIAIVGMVAAGQGAFAQDQIMGYIHEDGASLVPGEDYVYLRVVGDSMYPEFKPGDLVLVQYQPSVDSGSYAVVIVDDEDGVIKRVEYGNDFIELHSVNPMYPPRRFTGEDVQRIRIFGLVKGMRRSF